MAVAIHEKLTEWSPAVFAGYNSLEFDEDLLRQAFYQSLLPVYLTNTNGSSRLDVMRLALAVNEFEPGHLKVPVRDDGVAHLQTRPTCACKRFPPSQCPRRYGGRGGDDLPGEADEGESALDMGSLPQNGPEGGGVRQAQAAPVRLYTDFPYNKPNHWLVSAIAVDPSNSGNVIAFNLEHDPAELLAIGDESLRKWAVSKPKPLRTIKANSGPILLDIDMARGRADIMKIGEAEIMRRAQVLQEHPRTATPLAAGLRQNPRDLRGVASDRRADLPGLTGIKGQSADAGVPSFVLA